MAVLTAFLLVCITCTLASRPHPRRPPVYEPLYGPTTPAYGHSSPAYGHSTPAYGHPSPSYGYCDPKEPPHCATPHLSYCLEDPEYPTYDVKAAIEKDEHFEKKYADIPEQSADDLVYGLTKYQEEAFDYGYYTGFSKGRSPFDLTHWSGPEGYICPSDVAYAMPKRARNVAGEWRVIVNDVHYYTQTARLETCLYPDSACRLLAPCYASKCTQKYVYHRFLSYDPCDAYKGLFIDVYKLPSACSCHIPA